MNEPCVVLLVDDDVLVRNLVRRNLEEAGFVVFSAAHAKEALTLSREYPATIHAAVVDVELPDIDGITLAEHLLRERANMAILLVSAGTDRTIPEHMCFISKPFLRGDPASTLSELLAPHTTAAGRIAAKRNSHNERCTPS